MSAYVPKELQTLITLRRFDTHTTHVRYHTAHKQVEPVQSSRAACESHLTVKLVSTYRSCF